MNPKLRNGLKEVLVFVKYKALRNRGFDEDLSLKYALNYETIGECIEKININDYERFDVLKFISEDILRPEDHSSESVLQSICNNITNSSVLFDNTLNTNDNSKEIMPFRMRSFSEVVSDSIIETKSDDNYNLWKQNSNAFSSGDQSVKAIVKSIANQSNVNRFLNTGKAICRPNSVKSSDDCSRRSFDLSYESLSMIDSNSRPMSSVEQWINNESNYKNVAKLESIERPLNSSNTSDKTLTDRHSLVSVLSLKSLQLKRNPTNLHKLRGVYVGNLKPNFDHKSIKNRFKSYGTIVDFYQPSGAGYVFVHFKTHESPTHLIGDWQSVKVDECRDGLKLQLRFIPTQDQMQKYNSLTYSDYRKKVVDNGECDYWRSGSKCKYGKECFYKHIPINKSIDTLPDKRKSNWKL